MTLSITSQYSVLKSSNCCSQLSSGFEITDSNRNRNKSRFNFLKFESNWCVEDFHLPTPLQGGLRRCHYNCQAVLPDTLYSVLDLHSTSHQVCHQLLSFRLYKKCQSLATSYSGESFWRVLKATLQVSEKCGGDVHL